MCISMCHLLRTGIAAVAIAAWGAASADVVRVYEWSEDGGTPVISNAAPPASVRQYTIQTETVPAPGVAPRAGLARSARGAPSEQRGGTSCPPR